MAGGAYLIVAISFGLATGMVAKQKGSSFFLWLLIGTVLPVVGLIAALLYRIERNELRRQCPQCGAVLKLYDQVCTRCGLDLDFPEVAIAPESASRRR